MFAVLQHVCLGLKKAVAEDGRLPGALDSACASLAETARAREVSLPRGSVTPGKMCPPSLPGEWKLGGVGDLAALTTLLGTHWLFLVILAGLLIGNRAGEQCPSY